MQRFKSSAQARRFLSAHALVYAHFRPRRHLTAADAYRRVRAKPSASPRHRISNSPVAGRILDLKAVPAEREPGGSPDVDIIRRYGSAAVIRSSSARMSASATQSFVHAAGWPKPYPSAAFIA